MDVTQQVAYAEILGGEPVDALVRGFDLAERSCTFLPSPAELLKLAGRSPKQLEEQEIVLLLRLGSITQLSSSGLVHVFAAGMGVELRHNIIAGVFGIEEMGVKRLMTDGAAPGDDVPPVL